MSDIKANGIAKLTKELLGRKRIGTVTISNETEVFGQFLQMTKGHPHCQNTGTDTTVVRNLIPEDGARNSVHDKPDITFNTTNLYVSLIGNHGTTLVVFKVVNEGFDYDSGCTSIVGNHLMGYADTIQIFQSLRGFTKREAKVYMHGKA